MCSTTRGSLDTCNELRRSIIVIIIWEIYIGELGLVDLGKGL